MTVYKAATLGLILAGIGIASLAGHFIYIMYYAISTLGGCGV